MGRGLSDVGNNSRRGESEIKRLDKEIKRFDKGIKALEGRTGVLGRAFKALFESMEKLVKPLLLMGANFLAMVGTLGAFKLAMVAGEVAVKGYHMALTGLGAAAGIAIGAISGVLGAMRELQAAQMQPLFTKAGGAKSGATSALGRMQSFYADPQLAFFGDKALGAAMSAQMKAGGKADGAFRTQLTRYADFSGGDPKALQHIATLMAQAQKSGKITGDTYTQFRKFAPGLADLVEEMAGGADKAADAKIEFAQFNQAIMDGKSKALEPYNGALQAINNTVMGKLKTSMGILKEQLTSIGLQSYKDLYGTGGGQSIVSQAGGMIDNLRQTLTTTLTSVAPTIQRVMPQLMERVANGPFQKVGERLAVLIVNGMNKVNTFGANFGVWIGKIKNFFSQAAAYIQPFADAWDRLYNAILGPFLKAVATPILYWIDQLKGKVGDNTNAYTQWGIAIEDVGNAFKAVVDGLNIFSKLINPIFTGFSAFAQVISKVFSNPIGKIVGGWAIGLALLWKMMMKIQSAILAVSLRFQKYTLEAEKAAIATQQLNAAQGAGPGGGGPPMPTGGTTFRPFRGGVLGGQYGQGSFRRNLGAYFVGATPTGPMAYGMAGGGRQGGLLQTMPGRISNWWGGNAAPLGQGEFGPPTPMANLGMKSRLGAAFKGGVKNPMTGAAIGMAASLAGAAISNGGRPTEGVRQGLGGAISGAGTGAMMGSMFGPWGTLIGAGVGGVAGGVMGVLNAKKAHDKEKKEQAKNIKDRVLGGGFGPQTMAALDKSRQRAEQLKQKLKRSKALDDKINAAKDEMNLYYEHNDAWHEANNRMKRLEAEKKGLGKYVNNIKSYTGAMNGLDEVTKGFSKQDKMIRANTAMAKAMGMSAKDLAKWADKNGVELGKARLSLDQLQKLTGYEGTGKAADRAVASQRFQDTLLTTSNARAKAAQSNIDFVSTGTSYLEAARGGGLGADQLTVETNKFLNAMTQRQAARYAASGGTNYVELSFKTIAELQKAPAFAQARGVNGQALAELQAQTDQSVQDLIKTLTTYSSRVQADPTFQSGVNSQIAQWASTVSAKDWNKHKNQIMTAGLGQIKQYLSQQGINVDLMSDAEIQGLYSSMISQLDASGVRISAAMAEGGRVAAQLIKQAFPAFIGNTPSVGKTPGASGVFGGGNNPFAGADPNRDHVANTDENRAMWGRLGWTWDPISGTWVKGIGDTRSSRFGRVMARHNQLNNMIAGKRTITSGIRNFGLGSPSSDHATGAAYDITGQNLGAYQRLVTGTGGFAEFHGAGGNRHLHVVPGVGPVGDTATPVMGRVAVASGASTTNYYNVTINPAPGMSPDAIANAVMARIAAQQRDSQERR